MGTGQYPPSNNQPQHPFPQQPFNQPSPPNWQQQFSQPLSSQPQQNLQPSLYVPPPSEQSPYYQPPTTHMLPPQVPPPGPEPPFLKRKVGCAPMWLVLCAIGFVALVIIANLAGGTSASSSTSGANVSSGASNVQATNVEATANVIKATSVAGNQATITAEANTPTPFPTEKPAPTPKPTQPISGVLQVTHGTPHLGGPISDFYGKYGSQITGEVQTGSAPNGSPEKSVAWVTDNNDGYLLSVHFYTSSKLVFYIDYAGPSNWSKAQYRDHLLTFEPPGAAEDTQANDSWKSQGGDPYDPIAYTSDVGTFFLHISDGDGNMNTI